MFLVSSLLFFVWFPCGRLSWLHVSFWAHVNIVHPIIYVITKQQHVTKTEPFLSEMTHAMYLQLLNPSSEQYYKIYTKFIKNLHILT